MLSHITRFLRCPVCGAELSQLAAALRCPAGHSFDVASQGYVNLLTGKPPGDVDTPAMVGARDGFLAAGHYQPLAELLATRSMEALSARADDACLLEAGAGTGYFLAHVLNECPERSGIALDISKYAARRAARAHPRIGAVVADAWKPVPIRDRAVIVALVVFAPRNAADLHRVLAGGGRLLLVTPTPRHLREVIEPLALLHIGEGKTERLGAQFEPLFGQGGRELLEYQLRLSRRDLTSLVMMGPSAWHVGLDQLRTRIEWLDEPVRLTASFSISAYQRVDV